MFDQVERGLYWLSSFGLQNDVDSLCQIDHNIDDHTFVTTTGSLLTFFRIIGSRRYIGEEEFNAQAAALGSQLATLLQSGYGGRQHSVLFGFRSDKAGGRSLLKSILTPSVRTAKRFGADADWLFNDRFEALAGHVADETAVFGLLTHRAGMTPAEAKRADEARASKMQELSKKKIYLSDQTQMSRLSPPALMLSRHVAAVKTVDEKISAEGGAVKVMIEPMTCAEASRMFRRFGDAGDVPANWRAQLTGDVKGGISLARNGEASVIALPPRISRQVITERLTPMFGNAEMVKRGKYFYASLVMDVMPQEKDPSFSQLADAIGLDLPWQVHFDLAPNGLDFNKMERFFAGLFGAAGDHNKSIKAAWDELAERKLEGACVVALRAVFTTWATDETVLIDRLSSLKSNIESWSQTVVTNETAEPATALLASIPGFASKIPAQFLPGPISSVVRMMPAFRPSSVWENGQLVFHTPEGRPYPMALGTSLQNYWGTLVFAPTGSGKSFLMNMLNSGALFSPGLVDLPMITVIDKGPSAKAMIDLAKSMLPKHLADQCVYLRPTNGDSSFVSNPWDTQLGCDMPLPADRDFLCSLLQAMAPNLGLEGGKFVNRVVDVVYGYYSRRSPESRRWEASNSAELTAKLAEVDIEFSEENRPRIWNIVDAFFKKGMIAEASEAQLYAVPTMLDITTVLGSDKQIRSEYATATAGNGELIIDVFIRNIISAQQQYKLFTGVSRFKGSERVMVIDTEGLASSSASEEGKRVYAISLLFARRLGARNFFLHEDDIADISPEIYLEYHKVRAQKIRSELKFLEYDEIHNARGIGAVQELLQKDAREGRKYNIVTILSSQQLADFPKDLVDNSYNFLILGVGSGESSRELQKTFDLSDSEVQAIVRECTAPGKLFAIFRTSKGTLSQILHTRPGPVEKWAYSTNAADAPIRDALYEICGTKNTLRFLAKEFPTGSARPYIDGLRMSMSTGKDGDGITAIVLQKLDSKLRAFLDAIVD